MEHGLINQAEFPALVTKEKIGILIVGRQFIALKL
jgi:hypothetical protein